MSKPKQAASQTDSNYLHTGAKQVSYVVGAAQVVEEGQKVWVRSPRSSNLQFEVSLGKILNPKLRLMYPRHCEVVNVNKKKFCECIGEWGLLQESTLSAQLK